MKRNTSPSTPLSRRTFIKVVAVAGAAGACWQLGLLGNSSKHAVARRSQPIMGTHLNLTVYGPDRDSCEAAIDATIKRMTTLEGMLSRHLPTSALAQLNATGTLAKPAIELLDVLDTSQHIHHKSEGAFDITMLPLLDIHSTSHPELSPAAIRDTRELVGSEKLRITPGEIRLQKKDMAITLDGIGKGYVVDQGIAALKEHGFGNVCVEAGGDLMVSGSKGDGSPWRIGIRAPRAASSKKPVTLAVSDKAVATSGDYFQAFSDDLRHHHIIDPRTGFSSPELASCTVTAPNVALADGLATAVMVLGADNSMALLETMDGCEAYMVDKQLNSYTTSGFFS